LRRSRKAWTVPIPLKTFGNWRAKFKAEPCDRRIAQCDIGKFDRADHRHRRGESAPIHTGIAGAERRHHYRQRLRGVVGQHRREQEIVPCQLQAQDAYSYDAASPGRAGEGSNMMRARDRVAHVESIRPELCSLDVGTLNFEKLVFMNAPSELREMAERIRAAGTKPDLEVFDLGHIAFAKQLIREGLVEGPPLFSLVLGVRWGAPATHSSMVAMKDAASEHHWSAVDLGSGHPHRTIAQAILLGGGVRVGLEDSLYIRPGELAKSNAQQVEQTVRLIRYLGFEVATPSEARQVLGLNRN